MAIICPNGHINDDANRFCDQCGAPLQQDQGGVPSISNIESSAPSASTGSVICAQCGQQNLPGTAFCDNCGTALPPPQPAQDSAVMPSEAANDLAYSADAASSVTIVCPQCGVSNDATNRFCDNCGRSLIDISNEQQDDREQAKAMTDDARTDTERQPDAADRPVGDVASPDEKEAAPSAVPDMSGQQPAGQMPSEGEVTALEQASLPAPASASSTERQQLEETIATQRQLIDQLEQIQATFGAATPASVLQGLEEARSALAQAEADLQALQALSPAAPLVDPAEVARLEEEIATRRRLVDQLEQMQAAFGAATPASVLQGLEEARSALAQAEADLQTLTESASTPPTPAPEPAMAEAPDVAAEQVDELAQQPANGAAEQQPSQPQDLEPEAVAGAPASVEQQPAEPGAPAVTGPRLVTDDGQTIMLPRTEGDVLIGRQDPVSGVYPAVDLTPYGGEAGGVSRRHALLREQNGQWTIIDLDSTNYTRVNGNRIAPHSPMEIQDGARLQLGRLELEFHTS